MNINTDDERARLIGDSSFESWSESYMMDFDATTKQLCRDAYAAGMGDHLLVERKSHCACEFVGEENTSRCKLHQAWFDTLHEQADFRRERDELRAKLSEPGYEVWMSTDSCGEYFGWESVEKDEYDKAHPESRRAICIVTGAAS